MSHLPYVELLNVFIIYLETSSLFIGMSYLLFISIFVITIFIYHEEIHMKKIKTHLVMHQL